MHIPDGFIPLSQAVIYWIMALVFISLSLRWARSEMSEEKVPLVAVPGCRNICDPDNEYGTPPVDCTRRCKRACCRGSARRNCTGFPLCRRFYPDPRPDSSGNIFRGWRNHRNGCQHYQYGRNRRIFWFLLLSLNQRPVQ